MTQSVACDVIMPGAKSLKRKPKMECSYSLTKLGLQTGEDLLRKIDVPFVSLLNVKARSDSRHEKNIQMQEKIQQMSPMGYVPNITDMDGSGDDSNKSVSKRSEHINTRDQTIRQDSSPDPKTRSKSSSSKHEDLRVRLLKRRMKVTPVVDEDANGTTSIDHEIRTHQIEGHNFRIFNESSLSEFKMVEEEENEVNSNRIDDQKNQKQNRNQSTLTSFIIPSPSDIYSNRELLTPTEPVELLLCSLLDAIGKRTFTSDQFEVKLLVDHREISSDVPNADVPNVPIDQTMYEATQSALAERLKPFIAPPSKRQKSKGPLLEVLRQRAVKYERANLPLGDFMWVCRFHKPKDLLLNEEFRNLRSAQDDEVSNHERTRDHEIRGYEGAIDFVLEYVVERKTIPDLVASIVDGRYENLGHLLGEYSASE